MWRRAMVAGLGLCALGMGGGCRTVEEPFTYEFTGRLLDAQSRLPLSHVLMAVEDMDFDPQVEGEDWIGLSRTGLGGEFIDECTVPGAWGYTEMLGFIPLGSRTPPAPPPLREATLVVKRGHEWVKSKLTIKTSQQRKSKPGRRRIELGPLMVAGPKATTTAPAKTQPSTSSPASTQPSKP